MSGPAASSPRPLRIGHVFAGPFPALRGTQGYLAELITAQLARGDEVHLWCYAGALGGEAPRGLQLHRAVKLPGVSAGLRSRPGLARPLNDLALVARMLGDPLLGTMDLLHGHNHEGGLAGLMVARARGLPIVHQVHGNLEAELRSWSRASQGARAHLLHRLAPGAGLLFDRALPARADRCLRLRPSPLERDAHAIVLPVGVTAEARISGTRSRTVSVAGRPGPWIAYPGNLDPYQDLPRLFEAMRLLRAQAIRPRPRLLLLSHDPPAARSRLVARSGLDAAALEVCEVSSVSEVDAHLGRAALVLIPRADPGGLPLKMLNALGISVPVVTTRAAAAGLGEAEGVVATEPDARALADASRGVLEDPGRRACLARAAGDFARSHPWSAVAAACDRAYRGII